MAATTLNRLQVALRRLPGNDLPAPGRATAGSSGFDLRACVEKPITLAPGERRAIPTGFAMAIPAGYEAQVRPRSGLALRHGVTCLNTPGLIDSGYRGEVQVLLVNTDPTDDFEVTRGERIAQLVVQRVEHVVFEVVDELPDSDRGAGGWGHTGR